RHGADERAASPRHGVRPRRELARRGRARAIPRGAAAAGSAAPAARAGGGRRRFLFRGHLMTDSPLRVVVVDDEMLARQVLKEHLLARGDIEIAAECANGFEAVKAITELQPELVLLDIQMPKLDGFEVLELVGRQVPVIFVTAYDEFAVRAFEIHAIDYLLKPFSAERINEAIDRARARLRPLQPAESPAGVSDRPAPPTFAATAPGPTPPQLRAEAKPAAGPLERVLIRDGSRVHVIPVDDVDFVQAQDDYVCFHAGGKQYLKEQP